MYLNCHTYHSLRYGTLSVEDLVQQAADNKLKVMALTDINTITGIYEFYKLCQEKNIKPIVGMDVRVENEPYYICLAKNPQGIAEINRLLTSYNCEGIEIPKVNPRLNETFVIYSLQNIPDQLLENEFVGIRYDELNLLVRPEIKKGITKYFVERGLNYQNRIMYLS
ncbi:PHP domain-containing protein [Chryseobacterium indologenes]|uniref:PHP domain-containing protein n=1 Tax=Chryseobacterium indologenes TaxID=253 RepID=UPI003D3334FF